MRVLFKSFDSKMASREKIFKVGSEFASKIGEERLINITHSEDRDNIVITVWYWGEDEPVRPRYQPEAAAPPIAAPPVTELLVRPTTDTASAAGSGLEGDPEGQDYRIPQSRGAKLPPGDKSAEDRAWDKYTGS